MPWLVYLIWLGASTALLGPPKAWDRVDPTVPRGHYKRDKVEYRTWSSSPRVGDKECSFTLFALATQEKVVRLRINGVEQLLDWSWSWEAKLPRGYAGSVTVEFLDPVGGKLLASHDLSAECWG